MNPPDEISERGKGRGGLFGWLETALPVVVILALLVHPTQITLRQWANAAARSVGEAAWALKLAGLVPAVNITISEALLLVAFPPWLLLKWRKGALLDHVRRYPVGLLALLVCAALSILPFLKPSPDLTGRESDIGSAVRQLIQLCVFFVCAYALLADYLSDARWRDRLLVAFFAAVAVGLVTGLGEYSRLRPPSPEALEQGAIISAVEVDATFGFEGEPAGAGGKIGTHSNRNVVGAWLTLVLPLLWGVVLFAPRIGMKLAALILVLAGGVLLLQGGLWIAALAAVLAMSFRKGRAAFAATAVGMLLYYGFVFTALPQKHGHVLVDSLMVRSRVDRFRTLSLYEIDPDLDRSGKGAELEKYWTWQQKFVEWQPALLAFARSPLFGVGLGNYQTNVSRCYDPREHPDYNPDSCYSIGDKPGGVNLMEAGANPFYAVWLVECGLAGLLGFICLVLDSFARAAANLKADPGRLMGGLRTGACAALGAMCFGSLFTDYWVRGVGVAFVFVLALMFAPRAEDAAQTCRAEGRPAPEL